MEVVLIKDVEKLGQYGETKNVKSGFARNFLIPQGLAVLATDKAKEKVVLEKERYIKEKEKRINEVKNRKNDLEKLRLEFKLRTIEGKMFGLISNKDITSKILEKSKVDIDKKDIEVEKIHKLGNYEAKIKLGEGIKANIKIKVKGGENETKK